MSNLDLTKFQAKPVQGLYNYNHFEREDGAFIQVRVCGTRIIYQDEHGSRREFDGRDCLEQLKAHTDEEAGL